MDSLTKLKSLKALITFKRQVIINLIEKPNKDKRFISNWRPVSPLNVDQKLISQTLGIRLKKVCPFLIVPGQTIYAKGRF